MSRILVDQVRSNSASGDAITLDGNGKCAINATTINSLTFPTSDGSADQIIKTNGSGTLSFVAAAAGITMADSWRITSDFTGDAPSGRVSSNWERFDTSPWENELGTGLTQSSGIFTFPTTGYYFLHWTHYARHNGGSAWNEMELTLTNDGGSNYTALHHTEMSWETSSTKYKKQSESAILDITNTSQQQFYFNIAVDDNSVVTIGATHKKQTGFDIFRLGDT
tara:strand:- start:513 stop:1181 length:669 start_codon:yes stop_codon:yes gene_type:complete